jgi:23S rRNA pseudouridine2457 synthase
MVHVILFNKPYLVLCQFIDQKGRPTLADYIALPGVYPAGRLDYDSEGLVLLTNVGWLHAAISEPRFKLPKVYWVQVEGDPSPEALRQLAQGVQIE